MKKGGGGLGLLASGSQDLGGGAPLKIALAALLFGFCRALGNVYSGFDFLLNMNIPSVVYNMLPYIISLVVLAFTSKKSRAPQGRGASPRQGKQMIFSGVSDRKPRKTVHKKRFYVIRVYLKIGNMTNSEGFFA